MQETEGAEMVSSFGHPSTEEAGEGGHISAFPTVLRSLRERDADLIDILEAIADGVIVRNAARKMLYANEAAARLLGYPSTAAIMATSNEEFDARFEFADELGHSIDLANLPSRLALRGIRTPEVTLRFRNLVTGSTGWALVKSRPVFDAHGNVRLTVTIIHDVTEQKRVEEELRQARDDLERTIEERTAKHAAANVVFQSHLTAREQARDNVGDRAAVLREQARLRFFDGVSGWRLQWMAASFVVLALGLLSVRYLFPFVQPELDLNGVTYASLTFWCLASALLATGLLPASPPRFPVRIVSLLFVAVAILTAAILVINSSLPSIVYVAGPGQVAQLRDWHWIRLTVTLVLATVAIIGVARHGRRETAVRWLALALVLWAGARLYDLFWPSVYHSTFSIANVLRLAAATILVCGALFELRRLVIQRDKLLKIEQDYSAKLEDLAVLKNDFTAMVAHELVMPIAAIRTLTAVAVSSDANSDDHQHAINAIEVEANLLNSLVRDIETVAHLEREDFAVTLKPVELSELLAEAEAFAATLPGDHPLTTSMTCPGDVMVDRERMAQVLHNLLSNAAKFSPPGTPIMLRAIPEQRRVRIEVEDRGMGIEADELHRIFRKFGRGRDASGRRIPGVGLGLYVSRRILRMHGSDLTVISTPGTGTIFGFGLERVR
jgi:PAS domain S-box-containing protein